MSARISSNSTPASAPRNPIARVPCLSAAQECSIDGNMPALRLGMAPNQKTRGRRRTKPTPTPPRYRLPVAFACLSALGFLCGCMGGSLATDSGPGGRWSTERRQKVHVGERVNFSFALTKGWIRREARDPLGIADYCLATAGPERIEADLDDSGHYRFTYSVIQHRLGDVVNVSVAAYRKHGVRDLMRIGDEWVHAEDPYNQRDRTIARDSLQLVVYQTRVELPVNHPPADLEMASGRLEIRKADGTVTTVFGRGPAGRGFTYTGPDHHGLYRVIHEPTAEQIDKSGTTYVSFTVLDRAGDRHVFDGYIPTP